MPGNDGLTALSFLPETRQEEPQAAISPKNGKGGISILAQRKTALKSEIDGGKTYGILAAELTEKVSKEVSKGAVYKFIRNQNYAPTGEHLRLAFGLPKLELTEVCTKCGVIHKTKRCPNGKKRRRVVIDLPPDIDLAELAAIRSLSKEQRLSALMEVLR